MKRLLLLALVLLASSAQADVALVSVTRCAGGEHEIEVRVGNIVREVRDGAMANGSANLDSATAAWTAADVGRTVSVLGAGVGGNPLVAQIEARISATRVRLAGATAAATVSGRVVYVVGASATIADDESDEAVTLRLWVRRQMARGKTRPQLVGHKVIADVP